MKSEVYSWRLSGELKSDLERNARLRKVPVSAVLETAVRDWLKNSDSEVPEEDVQRGLQAAASNCFGTIASGNARRAETARDAVRKRLRRRHAR
jgi:predicted transcriptional regulator